MNFLKNYYLFFNKKLIGKPIKMSTDAKNEKTESTPIVVRVNSLTKELNVNSKEVMIISKKRLEYNEKGKKVPMGIRYVLLSNIRERKLIFSVPEIDDLLKTLDAAKPTGFFNYTVNTEKGIVDLVYKVNVLTVKIDQIEFIILALTELKEVIKRVDNSTE